ncbi:hypothetical protein OH76DRAFT_1404657 [Lentinus brumalis]|uniref:Uncharacterized protein n=1 Tax=Lentinus brumalis TaxID=2498619 RepID=A0A371D855_9APHY|nr:hypothetical protein OH76DRAFT_1404657 [Polyporus brumalis]
MSHDILRRRVSTGQHQDTRLPHGGLHAHVVALVDLHQRGGGIDAQRLLQCVC